MKIDGTSEQTDATSAGDNPNHWRQRMERILETNSVDDVTKSVAEAARESLVIGQS